MIHKIFIFLYLYLVPVDWAETWQNRGVGTVSEAIEESMVRAEQREQVKALLRKRVDALSRLQLQKLREVSAHKIGYQFHDKLITKTLIFMLPCLNSKKLIQKRFDLVYGSFRISLLLLMRV